MYGVHCDMHKVKYSQLDVDSTCASETRGGFNEVSGYMPQDDHGSARSVGNRHAGSDLRPQFGVSQVATTAKVVGLVEEIAQLEHRYHFLMEKNERLLGKVAETRSYMLTSYLFADSNDKARRLFSSWRSHTRNSRLLHQLDQQTAAVGECQQVTVRLGTALVEEQELRRHVDQVCFNTCEEIRQVLASSAQLQRGLDEQARRMTACTRLVREAEPFIRSVQHDAQSVLGHTEAYEKAAAALDACSRSGACQRVWRGGGADGAPLSGDPFRYAAD